MTRTRRCIWVVAALVACTPGCGLLLPLEEEPVDGGFDASARMDSGPPDAGPPDAGPPDAGPPDAGPPDAGPPDAGPPDAGPPDAGPPDAGPPDAGPPDAGPPDAGRPDAGPECEATDDCPDPMLCDDAGSCVCPFDDLRRCGDVCVSVGLCCDDSECPAVQQCTGYQCSCPAGSPRPRRCGEECLPLEACCTFEDCGPGERCVDRSCVDG